MRFRIAFIPEDAEEEIVLHCHHLDENIKKQCDAIEALISDKPAIIYHKADQEFYLPSKAILFFETDGETVYAHTKEDMYKVSYRLYQLEDILPPEFLRISKSTVANTRQIVSLSKTLGASVSVQFFNTHKQVYASKFYLKSLKESLSQRRR